MRRDPPHLKLIGEDDAATQVPTAGARPGTEDGGGVGPGKESGDASDIHATLAAAGSDPEATRLAPADADSALPRVEEGGWLGRRLGDFKIKRILGSGGMGVVYLAEQIHPRRLVAIKTLHAEANSGDLVARFDLEAEILARLRHPGIAQVHASGRVRTPTGVHPYIVMEYVEGVSLTSYAEKLGVRETVALLARICDAVQHAHMRGVIHRDLKPGNILVQADGQPKVLDFGIARLAGAERKGQELTSVGMVLGTIAYMSPEQASGDPDELDVRADVYALGMIGYRLLGGELPYAVTGRNLARALQVITTAPARPLSSLRPELAGDLEVILAKALAKEKEQRYQNAAELADDLRRHLNDEAIRARPPTAWAELRRFARRNKALFSGLSIAALALLAASVVSTRYALREQAERQQADAVVAFISNMLSRANPAFAQGHEVTVREVMAQAAASLDQQLSDAPRARARVAQTLADTYLALGEYPRALEYYGAAANAAADARTLAAAILGNADTLLELGRLREAQQALDGMPPLPAAEPLLLRADMLRLAMAIELGEGDDPAAEAQRLQAALAGLPNDCRGCDGEWRAAGSIELIALESTAAAQSGQLPAALLRIAEAVRQARQQLGTTHPLTLELTNRWSLLLADSGRQEEGHRLLSEALAEQERILGKHHKQTLAALNNLAYFDESAGQVERAEAGYREALGRALATLDRLDPRVATLQANLGTLLYYGGRSEEALPLLAEAHQSRMSRLGPAHPDTLSGALSHAVVLNAMGRIDAAGPLYQRVLAGTETRFGPNHRQTLVARSEYAAFLRDRGQFAQADALFAQALAAAEALPGGHVDRLRVLYQYSGSLQRQDRHAEAEVLSSRLLSEAKLAGDNALALAAPIRHARSLIGLGRLDEAERLLQALLRRIEGQQPQIEGMAADTLELLHETRAQSAAAR